VPVILDVVVVFLISIVVITANGNFLVMPLSHSLSDTRGEIYDVCQMHLEVIRKQSWTDCIERMEGDRPALPVYRKKQPR